MKVNDKSSAAHDNNIEAAIGTFVGFIAPDEFKTVSNELLNIIETKKVKKQLNDVRKMKVLKPELQEWSLSTWFPKAQKAGLKYFAFVVPEDLFGKASMDGANRNVKDTFGIEIQHFNSMDKAKDWLVSKN